MGAFNPQLIADFPGQMDLPPMVPEMPIDAPIMPQGQIMPPLPVAPPMAPAFVPQPIITVPAVKPPPKNPMSVSQDVARKAQGIYPAEQQQKQTMIDNAKTAMPTPSGAWGSPA